MKDSRGTNKHLRTARVIATLLDSQFSLFGIRFGLDPILGLIPGLGDGIAFVLSLYLIYAGVQMKLPASAIGKMIINILVDSVVSAFPVIGDLSDVVFRANDRNLAILERYEQNGILEGEVVS